MIHRFCEIWAGFVVSQRPKISSKHSFYQRKKTRGNSWDFWGVYLFTSLTYPSKATITTPDSYNLLQRILIGWSDVHYEPARLGLPLICCTRFEASGVAITYFTNVEEILGRDPRTDFHLEFIQRKKLLLLWSTRLYNCSSGEFRFRFENSGQKPLLLWGRANARNVSGSSFPMAVSIPWLTGDYFIAFSNDRQKNSKVIALKCSCPLK